MTLCIGVIPHHNKGGMIWNIIRVQQLYERGVGAELFSVCLMVCAEMVCEWIECDTGREKGS